jgi:hypothetical protein
LAVSMTTVEQVHAPCARVALFSKDSAVLCMRKRLERQGVSLNPLYPPLLPDPL